MKASILVVDDERIFRVMAEEALTSEGFDVRTAGTLAKARVDLDASAPDIVVLDRRLPDGDGIDLLKEMHASGGSSPLVVVVTAYGDIANAVDALRAGAVDYLAKPVQTTDLVVKLKKVLEARGLRDQLALAKSGSPPPVPPKSAAMRSVLDILERVSQSPYTPVLFMGPSGAGKQYAAESLHAMTHPDDEAPFVEINCAALPSNLVEAELFGHERGAFTDAKTTRRGLIEMAAGGTIFLDEIAELPEASQAKLLKFLDTMRFRRLGGHREIEVELRVVAATNQEVTKLIKKGGFREDLYHRLAVFSIDVPPLAARREDIPDLASAFVRHCASRVKKRVNGLDEGAIAKLRGYSYPGNVRELRNIIERAVILTRGPEVTEQDVVLPSPDRESADELPPFFSVRLRDGGAPPTVDEVERAYVQRVLEHMQGRRMAAAQALGISYPTFLKRLRDLGLDSEPNASS